MIGNFENEPNLDDKWEKIKITSNDVNIARETTYVSWDIGVLKSKNEEIDERERELNEVLLHQQAETIHICCENMWEYDKHSTHIDEPRRFRTRNNEWTLKELHKNGTA